MGVKGSALRALTFLLTVGVTPSAGQEVKGRTTAPGDQTSATASYEERKRLFDRQLKAIKLSLAGCGEDLKTYAEVSSSYQEGSNPCLRLVFTNTSVEAVYYSLSSDLEQARPQLSRGEDLVPYLGKVSEFLKGRENSKVSLRSIPVRLEPTESKSILISLGDWYEPLTKGRYKFSVKWRFYVGGDWVETPRVEFRVVPR